VRVPLPDRGWPGHGIDDVDGNDGNGRLARLGDRASRITQAGRGRTDDSSAGHKMVSRLSVVFLVIGVVAAAVLYDQVQGPASAARAEAEPTFITPSITDPAPLDGAWFCPMGSSKLGGFADHTVHISNLADSPAVANIIPVTEAGRGPVYRLEIPALSTVDHILSQSGSAAAAGAVVELIGGTAVVGHSVQTASGAAEGPCSTHVSNTWYFASGRTTRDATQYLALMNPFPEDVRYNIEFYRSAGRPRKPAALTGQEVPANSVKIIEVGGFVAREDDVAAVITTDRGRLVVERLLTFNGDLGPSGAALQLGVTAPATSWMLPAGRVHSEGDDRVIVFNPSADATATVNVELWPQNPADRATYGLGPIPRQLLPGRFEVIDLGSEAGRFGIRLPFEVGVSVTSSNEVPIVVERWQLAKKVDTTLIGAGGTAVTPGADPAAGGDGGLDPAAEGQLDLPGIFGQEAVPLLQPTANVGVTTSRGTEVLSTRWVVPWLSSPAENTAVVVVTSPFEAKVEVMALVNGELQGPFRASVPAGGRALISLPATAKGVTALVTADAPVSVEGQVVVPDVRLATVSGVPTVEP
jgi:hypothetical protein